MYELHHKVNPKEVIVGWYVNGSCSWYPASKVLNDCRYSTGSNLNTYSALIQNFYSQETGPHQAIHVAVNTGAEAGQEAGVKAYIRYVVLHFPRIIVADKVFISSAHPSAYSPSQKTVFLSLCP